MNEKKFKSAAWVLLFLCALGLVAIFPPLFLIVAGWVIWHIARSLK